MADNPKSLASLADELELQTIVVSLEMTQAEVRRTKEAMMAAAAALRAPTIARPVTDEMVDVALENYGLGCCYADDPCSNSTQEDCRERECHKPRMRAALEAALATPSPTIAAVTFVTDEDDT